MLNRKFNASYHLQLAGFACYLSTLIDVVEEIHTYTSKIRQVAEQWLQHIDSKPYPTSTKYHLIATYHLSNFQAPEEVEQLLTYLATDVKNSPHPYKGIFSIFRR